MSELIRNTKSVCPACLRTVPARLVREADGVFMLKDCPDHGHFRTIVWRDIVPFDEWRGSVPALADDAGLRCPSDCGHCSGHEQDSCCVLLEVTRRCNLHCLYCFADGATPEPPMSELKHAVDAITAASKPLLQLSGGEPTLRDDLPQLVAYIRSRGCEFVQINTNGLRLAQDEAYVEALAAAGANIIFLQFDGLDDAVYNRLRGRSLLDIKKKAISICGRYGLGVTLVPTIVRGVNDDQIGDIVRFGASLSPVVRGVHFQPVSYFGRYPGHEQENAARYTLDELIGALYVQGGIAPENISPSHCDHPGCGLHAGFIIADDGSFLPLTRRNNEDCTVSAAKNRAYIGSRWTRDTVAEQSTPSSCCCCEPVDMDTFLLRSRTHSFTVTAMAFQDAMDLDIERLCRCSLHAWDDGVLKPFCAKYLTPVRL